MTPLRLVPRLTNNVTTDARPNSSFASSFAVPSFISICALQAYGRRFFRVVSTVSLISFMGLLGVYVLPQPVQAQVTSSSLRGQVSAADGSPLSGATISLYSPAMATPKKTETNISGQFAFSGLRVGGPYEVIVKKSGFEPQKQSNINLKAGSNTLEHMALAKATAEQKTEQIKITAQRGGGLKSGSLYDSSDIQNMASINQDPKDVVRMSPDAYTDGESLHIGGQNNRFNSITIDGIRQDDDFGLNNNGYPTQRSPIAMAAIEEISLNRSPFDVRYGNFLGGNVNIVTKSGTNEFAGGVYSTYISDGLVGSKSKDRKYKSDFNTQRYGMTLGGPIIYDKVHFFLSLEGLNAKSPNNLGVAGSGQPIEVTSVSAAEAEAVQAAARDAYGYNAGEVGRGFDESDQKSLIKVDWTINDMHRLEMKHQNTTGDEIKPGSSDSDRLALTSNWYRTTETLNTTSLRLFSDWNYAMNSKLELSKKAVRNRQTPLEDQNFMSARVDVNEDGSVNLGPDPFRHANRLDTETTHLQGEGNYLMGDHLVTAGAERDQVEIFNLFVPYSRGEASYDSIDDFANRKPSRLKYSNAISNRAEDAAANWDYTTTTFYTQDEWQLHNSLTTTAGVRYERFGTDTAIERNENFAARHGFDNTHTIDGKSLLLPRLGANFDLTSKNKIRLGAGLYSGGTPNVWLSNNYTNNGVNTDEATTSSADGFDGRNIPDDLKNSLAAGDGNVDALDPDFKIPRSWKYSIGGDHRFDLTNNFRNLVFNWGYTYSKVQYGLLWRDLRRNHSAFANNQPIATGPDGRSLYSSKQSSDFDTGRGYDMLLTNTDKGYGHTASLGLTKSFMSGFSVSTSYAWQNVKDVSPANSSRSTSNYGIMAVGLDPNDPDLARSNYERTHRFLVNTTYNANLFGKLLSTVGLYFERRSGSPYSYTFGGKPDKLAGLFGEDREFARRERMLLYVPKGDGSDVTFGENIDEAEFNAYLEKEGLTKYRGRIAPRNAFTSSWVDSVDMRLGQELPGFDDSHNARVTFDIQNLPNLLNKKWGQVRQPGFGQMVDIVDVDYNAETGKYEYSNFRPEYSEQVDLSRSIWKMQVAVQYNF